MHQHDRRALYRSHRPPPGVHLRRAFRLHRRQHRAADGAVASRPSSEHHHRQRRLRDVDAGPADHRSHHRLLRRDRPRRLHRLPADGAARRAAAARPEVGRRAAALGRLHAAVVHGRGDDPRHPRRADQDRRAGPRGSRHRDVCGGRPHRAPHGDRGHVRRRRDLAADRVGRSPAFGGGRRASDGPPGGSRVTVATAAQAGLVSCEACGLLSRPATATELGHCPRCGTELAWRRHESIQRTWALVIAAAICYIPANVLPVLTTTALGSTDSDTIMGGVVFLYTSGSWPLALAVLVASVMIPLGKLMALTYLLITVQRGVPGSDRDRTRLYRLVEVVGRWSMLDVFVDTFTVALVQLQPLMSVKPGPGVVFFAAVVVLTMLSARSCDPRLIWDAGSTREGKHG